MKEKTARNNDTKCLLDLISAIILKKPIPKWFRSPDYEIMCRIADFQNVANLMYYAVIGMEFKRNYGFKKRLEERYHTAVYSEDRYSTVIPNLIEYLEVKKIHCAIIGEYLIREYYPQNDMKPIKHVKILVEKARIKYVEDALYRLGFEEKKCEIDGQKIFYKIPGITLVICTKLPFETKKIKKYYEINVRNLKLAPEKRFIHQLSIEQQYIYIIAKAAESFAQRTFDIREMVDIWCFYIKTYKFLNFAAINRIFATLEIEKFHKILLRLAAFWFTEQEFPESDKVYIEVEKFILNKGTKGRKTCSEILPILREIEIKNKKAARKARRKQNANWLFPDYEYMKGMFPELEENPRKLFFCHMKRINRLFMRSMTFRMKRRFVDKGYIEISNQKKQLQEEEQNKIETPEVTYQELEEQILQSIDNQKAK